VSVSDKILVVLRHAAITGQNVCYTKCCGLHKEETGKHIIIFSLNLSIRHQIKEDEADRTLSTHDIYT
jgi:hypothetical protein